MKDIRVGYGYDVHKLVANRPLVLGGVTIPHKMGLEGHSDADVLLHALCDAMLGAAGLGDIGKHFPAGDEAYKNIDSRILLRKCNEMINEHDYRVGNVDATVVAQQPMLAPFIREMCYNIATVLNLNSERISVKATTSEHLGFEGNGEGLSASAVVLIYKKQ